MLGYVPGPLDTPVGQRKFRAAFIEAFWVKFPATEEQRSEALPRVVKVLANAEAEVAAAKAEWERRRKATSGLRLPDVLGNVAHAASVLVVPGPSESRRRELWALALQVYPRQELNRAVSQAEV